MKKKNELQFLIKIRRHNREIDATGNRVNKSTKKLKLKRRTL